MIVLVELAPIIVLAVLFAFAIGLLASSVRVLREYQRGIVFRLGRLLPEPKGPGLFLLIPIVDAWCRSTCARSRSWSRRRR